MKALPACAKCGARIGTGQSMPNPQRDLFDAQSVVHAPACPPLEHRPEVLVGARDTEDGPRFRRIVLGRARLRPRLTRHPLGGGL